MEAEPEVEAQVDFGQGAWVVEKIASVGVRVCFGWI